jgi:hypothetical protein
MSRPSVHACARVPSTVSCGCHGRRDSKARFQPDASPAPARFQLQGGVSLAADWKLLTVSQCRPQIAWIRKVESAANR